MGVSIKLFLAGALGAFSVTVLAHDTETAYSSRGECERALATINNADRAEAKPFLRELEITNGDINKYFHLRFSCERRDGLWYIVDHLPNDG